MDNSIIFDNEKNRDLDGNIAHIITINERKNIMISGVKKIDSFDNEEFIIDTTLGQLVIKGNNLEIIKLDTFQGSVSIKGKIDNLNYVKGDEKNTKEESFLSKLFK